MAVNAKIGGGERHRVVSYSVDEDSTPIDPSDESGGVGQLNLVVGEFDGWKSTQNGIIDFTDSSQGILQAKSNSISEKKGLLTYSADSRLIALTVNRTAQPYIGTLYGGLVYYLSLVGINDGYVIPNEFMQVNVQWPGWQDEVFQQVARKVCPSYGIEMSLVSDNIVFRYIRGRRAHMKRVVDIGRTLSNANTAQNVALEWYDAAYQARGLAYPPGGWNTDVEVYTVNSGDQLVVDELPVDASLFSIEQPKCVLNVGPDDVSDSVYTVTGNDGFPIPPDMWRDYGGSLRLEINPDTSSLKLIIQGMNFPKYSPYSISVNTSASDSYSTLRVVGSGIFYTKRVLTVSTGLTEDEAPNETADPISLPYVQTEADAYRAIAWAVAHARGPVNTVEMTSGSINRASDNGSYIYQTFGGYDDTYGDATMGAFDDRWKAAGVKTFGDFDDVQAAEVALDFTNQAFGNVAGARIEYDHSIFRIRTATNNRGSLSITAEADNTFGDFDDYYGELGILTMGDFDDAWGDRSMDEFDASPFSVTEKKVTTE